MIQSAVERCLFNASLAEKLDAMDQLARLLDVVPESITFKGDILPPGAVQFPEKPTFVEPRHLKRRSLSDEEGLRVFLHAVAHIEFTAIHLALDAAYRFRSTPDAFRHDWLGVAIEETRHFQAVQNRMAMIGAHYGDYPAHRGLWELASETSERLLARMALIPRFMEARGLDVTPAMILKFERAGDSATVSVLDLILREEIGHVALGTRWYQWAAEQEGVASEDVYFELIGQYLNGEIRGPFNVEARKSAGFTPKEIDRLLSIGPAIPSS